MRRGKEGKERKRGEIEWDDVSGKETKFHKKRYKWTGKMTASNRNKNQESKEKSTRGINLSDH